jgi:acetoin utilization deacetylase AcuC-like enzyme
LPVYYCPAQVSRPASYSPSPRKPAEVVADWLRQGLPIDILAPEPVSREVLALAHRRSFVDDVLDCRAANGFGTFGADVAASLPWTTGSMLSAARAALANGRAAVSPTSGFHHAGYASASGYCTFNGLAVTAVSLLREGAVKRIGILDCDFHFGNGTEEIIAHLKLRRGIRHVTNGLGYAAEAKFFLDTLPAIIDGFDGCDLLLYQAGADPHRDDPLGGFLSTEELAERDRLVFEGFAALGIPVAWNLAGGYQEPLSRVLEIHANTLRACARAHGLALAPIDAAASSAEASALAAAGKVALHG